MNFGHPVPAEHVRQRVVPLGRQRSDPGQRIANLFMTQTPPAAHTADSVCWGSTASLSQGTVRADLASWLVAKEIGGEADSGGHAAAAERACQKLSAGLSRTVSTTGSQALVSRALHLARAEFPFLEGVTAGLAPGRCYEGLIESTRDVEAAEVATGLVAVLARLLDLLVKYIGEKLTLRMVWEVWPDLPLLALIEPNNSEGQEAST
jgi:hypothetical protein